MDEVLVDGNLVDACLEGTLDGVALREVLPRVEARLRSRTLRDNDGNLLSILWVRVCAEDSTDRRRLARCESESLLK